MSGLKQFIAIWLARKNAQSNGVKHLATAFAAKNLKMANAIAIMRFEEEYPDISGNYFEPKICESLPASPRPALDVFSDTFLDTNEWDATNKTIKPIELKASTQDNLNPDAPMEFFKHPVDIRVGTVVLLGTDGITNADVSSVIDFMANEENGGDAAKGVINGISAVQAVSGMNASGIALLVSAIEEKFGDGLPSADVVQKFVEQRIYNPQKEESNTAEFKPTKATPDIGNNKSVYDIMETDVALSITGVNPTEAKAADVKLAKDIKDNRDSAWRAITSCYRVIVGITDVDRETRHNIVQSILKNLELINNKSALLHFIKTQLSDNPACPELSGYTASCEEEASEVADEPQLTSLGGGKFGLDDIFKNSPLSSENLAQKNHPEPPIKPQEVDTPIQPQAEIVATNDASQGNETAAPQPSSDQFQSRAELVASEIASKSDSAKANLNIWQQVQRTDPRFTKPLEGVGYTGTSINSEYMFMRATEIFGPVGSGWGFEIVEDKMLPGAPMSESVYGDNKKFLHSKMLRDADGTLICELNHSLKITFWYLNECGQRSEFIACGATPYLYKTKNGIKADNEAVKKSLTDAIKKALSMLGFSADVYLGYHDNAEYLAENSIEFSLKNAVGKVEDGARLRTELDEKLSKVADTLKTAVTKNEAEKILSTIAREVEVHRKNAESIGDKDHAKYLSGRLARLNKIKNERITELETTQEKTA